MAFDGPGPFEGDPVFNYLDQVSSRTPAQVEEALASAFREVILGGAARHISPDIASVLGLDLSAMPAVYLDVDEGVWAWACAEMLVVALGHQPASPIPDPFLSAAQSLPSPRRLVSEALTAIEIVGDPKRSELAGLLEEAQADEARRRIADLRQTLASLQLRAV